MLRCVGSLVVVRKVFFRRAMRLICRLSELLIGVYNFVCRGAVVGWVMGHIDWARLWYWVKVFITSFAALSISLVVVFEEMLRVAIRSRASSRADLVA